MTVREQAIADALAALLKVLTQRAVAILRQTTYTDAELKDHVERIIKLLENWKK